jgi:hypothetical protein
MSALPPKADIARRHWHVRLVPLADSCTAAKRRRGLVDLGPALHALVRLRQRPKLAREVGAIDEVWLVVVRAAVENVQAHAGAAKLRRRPDPIAISRYHDVPELAREVRAIDEVWLVVFRSLNRPGGNPLRQGRTRPGRILQKTRSESGW